MASTKDTHIVGLGVARDLDLFDSLKLRIQLGQFVQAVLEAIVERRHLDGKFLAIDDELGARAEYIYREISVRNKRK